MQITKIKINGGLYKGDATHEYTTSQSNLAAGKSFRTVRMWSVIARGEHGKLMSTDCWIVQDIDGIFTLHGEKPSYNELTRRIPCQFGDAVATHRKVAKIVTHVRCKGGEIVGFHWQKNGEMVASGSLNAVIDREQNALSL